ncbi:hypothetical protein N658DRAFT_500805 [Parathielavia hyrcaniae]|uniref:Bys1 family protein n=1 Tax=Parathielavia hyrcaniae TaxID=113614 RepID=A0AAN6PUY8_9PEZI|nr:hypothetical protein N658DRAFT_500805 [Parathielavia hyrcaniae]
MLTHVSLALATVAATAPLASALGLARVVNNCTEKYYIWSVNSEMEGPFWLNPNGGSYGEEFLKDPVTGGTALKIAGSDDGLFTGAPQTIFAYNPDGDRVWYDLSDVFGNQFAGKKLVVESEEESCGKIVWPSGVPPGGSQVKVCRKDRDVVLTLCAC